MKQEHHRLNLKLNYSTSLWGGNWWNLREDRISSCIFCRS